MTSWESMQVVSPGSRRLTIGHAELNRRVISPVPNPSVSRGFRTSLAFGCFLPITWPLVWLRRKGMVEPK
jgi:hypothetical protein